MNDERRQTISEAWQELADAMYEVAVEPLLPFIRRLLNGLLWVMKRLGA